MASSKHIMLAITGASGTAYAVRLGQVLLNSGLNVHLVMSSAARQVAVRELESQPPTTASETAGWLEFFSSALNAGPASSWGFKPLTTETSSGRVFVHGTNDYNAGIASGSFLTRGMVICPCSMGTLSSIACGASTNLIQRAADVHLKERRPLVLMPRETPLSLIALENMAKLTQAGATIMPAMPGLYHQPACLADLIDFCVARICDHLKVEHQLMQRWGATESE